MNDRPLVSVIVPTRNSERFVEQAVQSVTAQDYRPIELIVVDGRSTDGTAAIVARFDQARWITQPGSGIADAWNAGIDTASGDWLAFLSSDDMWTPDKLSTQVGYMLDHPDLQYTIAKFEYRREPGMDLPKGFNENLLGRQLVGRIMETLVARRGAYDVVGRYNVDLPLGEDVDWYARAKDMNIAMAMIDKVLLHKRVHDANASTNAARNTPLLLKIMRESIARQRAAKDKGSDDD